MFKTVVRGQIDKFEKEWAYDTSYLREILDGGGLDAVQAVNGVTKLGTYRRDVPIAPYYAAKIASVRQADCGPCTQLIVTMAERVHAALLRALLAGRRDELPADVCLAYDFARATLAHEPEADDLREQVVARWGKRGLISIAFAITSAQIYPTLKYALGHGRACTQIRVGDEDVTMASHPSLVSSV